MEVISPHKIRAYKDILDQISTENAKCEALKSQIDQETHKIALTRLKLQQLERKRGSNFKHEVGHTTVKVFNNLLELYDLYKDDLEASDYNSSPHCHYYLVEVFLCKSLSEVLSHAEKWVIQVSVITTENPCSTRNLVITGAQGAQSRVCGVITVSNKVFDCQVFSSVAIITPKSGHLSIDLPSVDVDISYHFETNRRTNQVTCHGGDVAKVIKSDIVCAQGTTLEIFRTAVIRNCYHRVPMELLGQQGKEVQLAVGGHKIGIMFDGETRVLKVKCSSHLMEPVIRYFSVLAA